MPVNQKMAAYGLCNKSSARRLTVAAWASTSTLLLPLTAYV